MTRKTSKTNYYEKLNCCFCLLFLYTEYIYILNTYLLVRRKTVCFVAPRPPLVYTKCRTTKNQNYHFFIWTPKRPRRKTSHFTSSFHRDVYRVSHGNGQWWFLAAAKNYAINITIYGPPPEDFSSNPKIRKVDFGTWHITNIYIYIYIFSA